MADNNTYVSKVHVKKYTTQEKFDALDKSDIPVGTEYNVITNNQNYGAVCTNIDGEVYYRSLSAFGNLRLENIDIDDWEEKDGNKLWLEVVATEYGYSAAYFAIIGGGMSNTIYTPNSTTVESTTSGFTDGTTIELVSTGDSQGTIIFHVGASSSTETALGSFSVSGWTYIKVEKIRNVYSYINCVIETDGTVKTL